MGSFRLSVVSSFSIFAVSSVFPALAHGNIVVSNLAEASFGQMTLANSRLSATQFATGSGSWNFNLVTALLRDNSASSPDIISIQVYGDNAGVPGSLVGSFDTSTQNIGISLTNYTYLPSAPLTLAGNTNYWMVGRSSVGIGPGYAWGVTGSPNDNGLPGWSIGNTNVYSDNSGASWLSNGNTPMLFSIDATPVPEPATLTLLAGSAVLFLRRR